MPGKRPATSGYARIAQAEEEDSSDNEDPFNDPSNTISFPTTDYAPIQPRRRDSIRLPSGSNSPGRPGRRRRANSGVDIKAINARLERWADEIKDRFKRRRVKGKTSEEEQLEIHHSVFQAPDWIRPATKETLEADYGDEGERMSKLEFDDLVESVRTAIELGLHPKLIAQGSSGSYFARSSGGKVVGVFKPKDEEPYASKNPKWTKWIHRNLFPFAFGRAMLIPNLSYVSEAAAYVLDCQLRTNLVPYTDVVGFSSKSFHYDWMDRRAYYRKGRPLPEKLGSFQVFLKGYKGATDFFREHPWPDQSTQNFSNVPSQKRKRRKRWDENCRPKSRGGTDNDYDSDDEEEGTNSGSQSRQEHAFWSEDLQQSFREELEKLVILDYVMRNTDRGTDNWMIKIDRETQKATIVSEPIQLDGKADDDVGYHRRKESMSATPNGEGTPKENAIPRVGAIDNSLSWPWKHPDAWRSYPFGWLFLPVSLIGRPFSEKTRKHFLPLLTSKEWWSETQVKLRRCFEIDADFQERMFARQMAVMKGQAWNVVETLKTPDHGPLELTRRNRVHVWDDLVDIPVAVPLPRASEEMRRRAAASNAADSQRRALAVATPPRRHEEEEEMDITSTLQPGTAANSADLLGLTGTSLPTGVNRFNQSRQPSAQDINRPEAQEVIKEHLSPELQPKELKFSPSTLNTGTRPGTYRSRTGENRMSHDIPRSQWQASPQTRSRRFSLNFSRSNSLGAFDDDGDLGYAAAADQESSMRKVIVERLEMVKSKPPVFTWC
ncbi:Phosphatidylinositol 4-kinase lsb6 [Fulvia fulva]|nr:Phosphatidylinositol 4-kinase lsb6 [Fulvia fulva]KAK4633560.1 Phosphatidylinositol 4-kinase lsb6 [Fulvia fulva]WPV10984.1 Phosphatidylinositol 4-kinase lsb6 [Fulvia fulva]WPV26029.1 Phosphatidylinositol 4-kinase lsb6 [Fulvia fulva]